MVAICNNRQEEKEKKKIKMAGQVCRAYSGMQCSQEFRKLLLLSHANQCMHRGGDAAHQLGIQFTVCHRGFTEVNMALDGDSA